MTLKKRSRYLTPLLVIGASITLGFLAFSGIYALLPILGVATLGLAISGLILAVGFEGEIYLDNIKDNLVNIFRPNYVKSRLAKECLREAEVKFEEELLKQEEYEDLMKSLSDLIETINKKNKDLASRNAEISAKYNIVLEKREKIKSSSENEDMLLVLNAFPLCPTTEFIDFLTPKKRQAPDLTSGFCTVITIDQINQIDQIKRVESLLSELQQLNNQPNFLHAYYRITHIDHYHAHKNLKTKSKNRKDSLEVSQAILEKIFAEELFYEETNTKKSQQLVQNHEDTNADPEQLAINQYREEIRSYLKDNYRDKYLEKLPKRTKLTRAAKAISTVCGGFMILGTSYLLVEAFSIIPFLSAIPFGILPILIVPLAVIAGTAYGVITYSALDEMIHDDIIVERMRKIKADYEEGLDLYKAFKLLVFVSLLGLAVTLTVCTGGTWWTVIKHTKPLFGFLRIMPTAVTVIIAAFLSLAALAFNIINSLITFGGLEELAESEPEEHSCDLDLLAIEDEPSIDVSGVLVAKNDKYYIGGSNTQDIELTKNPALIKQDNKYFIHGCNSHDDDMRSQITNWQRKEIASNAYFSLAVLNALNFDAKVRILHHSIRNLAIYLVIKLNNSHIFNPSKENMIQFLNPFRFFLLLTYVPLRIVVFLGHLASISATADQIPSIPAVISMIIGFVAELFEDLHYFVSFTHTHKADIGSLMDEHFKNGGGCNHDNDLPTRILRDYVFYIVFYCSAAWDSICSDRLKKNPDEKYIPFWHKNEAPSVIFENSLDKMMGKGEQSEAELSDDDEAFADEISSAVTSISDGHKGLELEDIEDLDESAGVLLAKLSFLSKSSRKTAFVHRDCPCCPTRGARSSITPLLTA
jgi:hypothetical protein